jgi:hypothetical protein
VTIDLIVRDTCRLRPGIGNVSSTIKVVSVIGRFLEHARIYYFHNGGRPEYYLGSADAMQRNLEKRVEVLVPIEDPRIQSELRHALDTQLSDQRGAWDMCSDGSYVQRTGMGAKHCQQQMIRRTERRGSGKPPGSACPQGQGHGAEALAPGESHSTSPLRERTCTFTFWLSVYFFQIASLTSQVWGLSRPVMSRK